MFFLINFCVQADIHLLSRVIPYLRLDDNQRYLVARIRHLATHGGYRWKGGGTVEDALKQRIEYKDDMPTDAEVWCRRRERL